MARSMFIGHNLIADFSAAVEFNTSQRVETLGWLCGEEVSSNWDRNVVIYPQI